MDLTEQCPEYNDFGDLITHYSCKLHLAADQIQEASSKLASLEGLAQMGWQGPSGEAFVEKTEELKAQLRTPDGDIDAALVKLGDLTKAIQTEIDRLTDEWNAQQEEAAAELTAQE